MPYFDDDGSELNPILIPKPPRCVACQKDGFESELVVCNLTRLNQRDMAEFVCLSFVPRTSISEVLPR